MGGYSSEYKISLKSGEVVYNTLDRKMYNPYRIHIFKNLWVLFDDKGTKHPIDKHDFSAQINGTKIKFDCISFIIFHKTIDNQIMI